MRRTGFLHITKKICQIICQKNMPRRTVKVVDWTVVRSVIVGILIYKALASAAKLGLVVAGAKKKEEEK